MNGLGRGWIFRRFSFDQIALRFVGVALMAGLIAVGSRAKADDKPGENKIPDPVNIDLETSDGLQLKATYYGTNPANADRKNSVPIIMLHGWKGSRADFSGLALEMQGRGCAVLVPDLRGHGKSTQIKRDGNLFNIDQANLRKGDIELMVTQDLEALKTFLMDRNNAGELNIEKLCVLGNEMGATIAVQWALYDWHWPQLPTVKQGQDVKALILISPQLNFHGVGMSEALGTPLLQTGLSVLLIVGEKNSKKDEANRINKRIGAGRPKPSNDPKEMEDRQDLFLAVVNGTSLQGPNIFNDTTILPQLAAKDGVVSQFVEWRLVDKKFPWTNRKPALGQ
jgi:pimeloyl-ACP methyl ester carboxylesterase